MDIPQAVVINLPRRPDRLDVFQQRWNLAALGIRLDVLDAVDGVQAYPDVPPPVAVLRGCWASHRAVLGGYRTGPLLVLEDDAVIIPHRFVSALRRVPDGGWDVLRLGGAVPDPYQRAGWHRQEAHGSHAYIVRDPAGTLDALLQVLDARPALAARPYVDALLNTSPGGWVHTPAAAGQDRSLGSDVTGLSR
jgi:hypothetical protein